jgi:hypothetical protein
MPENKKDERKTPTDSGEQGISNRPEEAPNEPDTGSEGSQSDNPDRRPAKRPSEQVH